MKFTPALSLLAFSLFVSAPLLASDNPAAHQHGHAEMQFAIDDGRVDLIFTSPAHNLLGFEHKARTPEQKQQVLAIQRWLENTPLINTISSTCTVENAVADIDALKDRESDEHGHDEHAGNHEQSHSDIEVTQVLACTEIASSRELVTSLTRQFPAVDRLDISWVGPEGQGSTRLASGENNVSLAQ
ncbi:DUF2796 domain-containing protein [Marinobacter salinexigens]|uniref:DUF2796 domain-containing protein n=1 Tax=Marinobacter salinexigens TaxID=2919747 RepID=A0A5B0VM34_9GAMM|nr:DUF2796 domain-containing protein [Marinobacter salinexigens]KAA1175707.1 DUF2796 domain-containing protein [Marinobacter salinexigens]